jgi:hypothetical protein
MAINVPIISQFNSKGIDDAKKKFKELETPGQKAGFALKKAFVPATAALGGLVAAGVNFTKVAMEDQKSLLNCSQGSCDAPPVQQTIKCPVLRRT